MNDMRVTAVVPCGGKGTRMGTSENKLFLPLLGESVLAHTLRALASHPQIEEIIVAAAPGEEDRIRAIYEALSFKTPLRIVPGGAARQDSVASGVRAASGEWVLVHDGARALVSAEIIRDTLADAAIYGGAAAGIAVKDTLKKISPDGKILKNVDREHLVRIQTPQVFRKEDLEKAYQRASAVGLVATDECALMEEMGISPFVSKGSEENIKITTPDDLVIAEAVLKRRHEA